MEGLHNTQNSCRAGRGCGRDRFYGAVGGSRWFLWLLLNRIIARRRQSVLRLRCPCSSRS